MFGLIFVATEARPCSYSLGPGSGTFAVDAGEYEQSLPAADAGADPLPPSQATIRDVKVRLVENGGRGEGVSCPDVDTLSFSIDGNDDVTPTEELFVAAFVAADPNAVVAKAEPDLYFRFDYAQPQQRKVTFALGTSFNRERDGGPFRSPDRFCFAVALRDRGGSLGPRSEPACLDTDDVTDPHVKVVPSTQGGCSAAGAELVPTAILALAALARSRRRRQLFG